MEVTSHSTTDFTFQSIPGPLVGNEPTTIQLLSALDLETWKFASSCVSTVNQAFSQAQPPWLPASHLRLTDFKQFRETLGDDSLTLAIILDDKVLATASTKPFIWKPVEEQDPAHKTFVYWDNPGEEQTSVWEIKLMAVHPSLRGQGLASLLLAKIEVEVKKRLRLLSNRKALELKTKVKFILRAFVEINGPFYEKRGFSMIEKWSRPIGFLNSETGFHIASYQKVLDV